MKVVSLTGALLVSMLLVALAGATVIHVPGDYPTIQGGINQAVHGDTVLVAPDSYMEHINFLGKAILVKSEAGPEVTIIEADPGTKGLSVVTFNSQEDSNSIIDGFTIQNAYLEETAGGGVNCFIRSSPTIRNNIIKDNYSWLGGGIYAFSYSSPHIYDNLIVNNEGWTGGGILCDVLSKAVIIGNEVAGNAAVGPGGEPEFQSGRGGGIFIFDACTVMCRDNIVYDNSARKGGGIFYERWTDGEISNNTVYNNEAWLGGGIYIFSLSTPLISNNTIKRNQASIGGGILIDVLSSPVVTENLIIHNTATDTGGGIYCFDQCSPQIINNTLDMNRTLAVGGGIACRDDCYPEITNNIISNVPQGYGIFVDLWSNPTISYNDVWGALAGGYYGCSAGPGDISADPMYCDAVNEDYQLYNISPCVGAGQGGADMGAFGVGCYAGYGVQVFAGPDVPGAMGTTVETKFHVKNVGLNADTYTLEASDSLGWNVYPASNSIFLAPDQGDTVIVYVEIAAELDAVNKVTLTATSQGDPAQSDSDFLFVTSEYLCGDVNLDGQVDLGDVVYLLTFLYKNGPPPCEPGLGRTPISLR